MLRENQLVEASPDRPVAFDAARQYTEAELLAAVGQLASRLRSHRATNWLLVHDNCWHFTIGLLALLVADKHPILPPNALPATLDALQHFTDALLGEGIHAGQAMTITPAPDSSTGPPPLYLPEQATITLFTSGSTGKPQAIRKPVACLLAEVAALESLWGETLGQAAIVATVPHQHLYGLLFRLLWPLVAGRPFAIQSTPFPEQLMAAIARWAPCALVASPAQLKRFTPAPGLTLPRCVFSSGGPLPVEAAGAWRDATGSLPFEILGSTETGGIAWRQQSHADAAWIPLPGVNAHCDANGQLVVDSPFTGATTPIRTGDRAVMSTASGGFQLLGRVDRIVKVEEKRLSLTAMECRLEDTRWVSAARITVLPDGRTGAVAVLTDAGQQCLTNEGKPALVAQLRHHLAQAFEPVLLPRKWRFPDQLPANALGKTTDSALVSLFSGHHQLQVCELATTDSTRRFEIHIPPDADAFAGHFPGLPILPGVIQLDLAIRHCATWYPPETFQGIDKLKFQEPVVPGDLITLRLEHRGPGEVGFTYRLGEQTLSSGRILFAC